ncbi:hypothetical protein AGMMS49983_15270 [Clostridia bacterium]|nr:hypothetical protein AGMMS49983_15270 [Clostridia bacterium]
MPISYDKLWKLLIDKKMNRTELKDAAGLSSNVIAKMGKCETISMDSMLKICKALGCDISDMVEVLSDDNGGEGDMK